MIAFIFGSLVAVSRRKFWKRQVGN